MLTPEHNEQQQTDEFESTLEYDEQFHEEERPSSFFTVVGEAIRGSMRDYTKGPIDKAILFLAVPMVLEMFMESIFAVADVMYVSRLGADAVAVVGLTESMLTIVYAIAMGLGIGAMAMIARRIGEGDRDGAARAAVQSILLAIFVSVIIGIAGVILAPDLLKLMGGSPEVIEMGTPFIQVMLGGNLSIVLLFLINAIFRGAGDAAVSMRVLALANVINIALAPCLIFGPGPFPELGVTGAAIATTIGRGIGALFAISMLFRSRSRVRVHRHHIRLDSELMRRITGMSTSAALQVSVGMISWVALVRIVSSFGSEAVAGYTIAMRIIMFALLPSFGMSNAAATMVGQALGAGLPDRAEKAVWRTGFFNVIFLGAVGVLFVLFAEPIIHLITSEEAVVPYAVDALRIVAAGFLFYAYGMVFTQSFNGAGDTQTPTWINIGVFWCWECPLAYVLAVQMGMGPHGIFLAVAIAFSTLAVVSGIIFKRGAWKKQKV